MGFAWLGGDFWRYASIPVISAIVGYVTNQVAIRMMFYPIEYRGLWRPYLGWQGIVPRKASKMTGVAVDTLTDSLIDEQEIFSRIDADEIATVLAGPMRHEIEAMAETIMNRRHPRLWHNLPETVRHQLVRRLQARSGRIVVAVNRDLRENLRYLFDLDGMIVRALVREKELLNEIFLKTGHAEFQFIARSGLWFGFLFGLVQMGFWLAFQAWWQLPLYGLGVGWATNWVALKMIFHPRRARQVGPWRIQGLFFRRQNEVADDYGRLVAARILTPSALIEEFLTGPYADKLYELVCVEVDQAIDAALSTARPLVGLTFGQAEYERLKADARVEAVASMPRIVANAEPYLRRCLDIEKTLSERLKSLTPARFEAMLRPAFEEDEWILIAVGAVLGMAVGWFQLVVIFYDVFAARFGSLV